MNGDRYSKNTGEKYNSVYDVANKHDFLTRAPEALRMVKDMVKRRFGKDLEDARELVQHQFATEDRKKALVDRVNQRREGRSEPRRRNTEMPSCRCVRRRRHRIPSLQ